MRAGLVSILLALAFTPAIFAQDERSVASPDGHIQFRIFIADQAPGDLLRLAYEVSVEGRSVIEQSYLGLDIWNRDPLLGENDGLTASHMGAGPGFNSLVAEYMQNGSIGRRITVEVRVYNDGVAFRYQLPHTTPLDELLIANETTEFRLARGGEALRGIGQTVSLPLIVARLSTGQGGMSFLAIAEIKLPDFPQMTLARLDESALVSRLARKPGNAEVAFEGTTPWTGPWRLVILSGDRNRLLNSPMVRSLNP